MECDEYYQQRCEIFMGKHLGYYIKNKYYSFKLDSQSKFALEEDNILKNMSWVERNLLMRVLSNQANLKSISFKTPEFGKAGAYLISNVLDGSYVLEREDEVAYRQLSHLLASVHEKYLWEYIDKNDELASSFNITDESILSKITRSLQEHLQPFQTIADWKTLRNVPETEVHGKYSGSAEKSHYCIERLYLSTCNIDAKSIEYIVQSLCHHNSLKTLTLDHNNLQNEGAIKIGRMLSENATIEEIDVSNNGIGGDGMIGIILGWHDNKQKTKLKTIDLSYNKAKLEDLETDENVSIDTSVFISEFKDAVQVANFA